MESAFILSILFLNFRRAGIHGGLLLSGRQAHFFLRLGLAWLFLHVYFGRSGLGLIPSFAFIAVFRFSMHHFLKHFFLWVRWVACDDYEWLGIDGWLLCFCYDWRRRGLGDDMMRMGRGDRMMMRWRNGGMEWDDGRDDLILIDG